MYNNIIQLLKEEGIELCSILSLSNCIIKKEYLLKNAGISEGSVFIFAIPYYTTASENANISAYAVPRDYHYYVSELRKRIIPKLRYMFPNNKFEIFTDHSPIDERNAACLSGLGILGKNGMIITDKYSSFIFLAEIISDCIVDYPKQLNKQKSCLGCGQCVKICPSGGGICLSALTQKKGELNDMENEKIKNLKCAWGCDMCQLVCPYTVKAKQYGTIYSAIPFFNENLTPMLTVKMIEEMSDEEFMKRAYSWRKKETIIRNLKLLNYLE